MPIPLFLIKSIKKILWGPSQRSVWVQTIVLLFFLFIGWSVWLSSRSAIEEGLEYQIGLADIQILSPPEWLPSTFVDEAFRSRSEPLNGRLDILNPQIFENFAKAFEAHPWVDKVESIQILNPPQVLVRLKYREPVAFVILAPQETDGEPQVFMIDGEGYYLSKQENEYAADFASYRRCLIVQGIQSSPLSQIGEYWGDPLIYETAALASFLIEKQEDLDIAKIDVRFNEIERIGGIYELSTKNGTKFHWGTFPLNERLDDNKLNHSDPKSKMIRTQVYEKQRSKLDYLKKLAKQYGSLDSVPSEGRPLDLSEI